MPTFIHTNSPFHTVSLAGAAARYYNSDLSIWISVDPMVDKYPNLSPYTYCTDNPVRLVDPDGRVPIYWPRQGTNIFFCKAKIGAGVSYGLAGSIIGGIALDQHGMTHWTASNSKYFTNQNLYDGTLHPAIEVGCDISISLGFERHTKSETFLEAINDVAYSLSFSGKYRKQKNTIGVRKESREEKLLKQ